MGEAGIDTDRVPRGWEGGDPVGAEQGHEPAAVFVAGYSVSTFGNYLNLVALNLYAYHLTGSALQTRLLMAIRLAAGFLVAPVAGGLVTRFDPRTVMIATDVAQALAVIALLAVPAAGHPQLLYTVAVILGSGNTIFNVAVRTSVPELVGDAERLAIQYRQPRLFGHLCMPTPAGTDTARSCVGKLEVRSRQGDHDAVWSPPMRASAWPLDPTRITFTGGQTVLTTDSRRRYGTVAGAAALLVVVGAGVAGATTTPYEYDVEVSIGYTSTEQPAPGLLHKAFTVTTSHGSSEGHLLEIDLSNPKVSTELLHAEHVAEGTPLTDMAASKGAFAAVNADFFNMAYWENNRYLSVRCSD
ncbi:MFS transporter [Micromonospora sp. NPDC023814]|uniref:MFS transporter n=1 Tax=Micromonospora sp. NPDC023814 TaxID=3154596 RepID=UPI00340F683D